MTQLKEVAPKDVINEWLELITGIDWEQTVVGVAAEHTPSGLVYDLPNFAPDKAESFAIVDLRDIGEKKEVDEPHYHINGEVEVHIPLSGHAKMVVGDEVHEIGVGDCLTVPTETAHFAVPDNEYVVAIVSLPNFDEANYVPIEVDGEIPSAVHFARDLYLGSVALSNQ